MILVNVNVRNSKDEYLDELELEFYTLYKNEELSNKHDFQRKLRMKTYVSQLHHKI